VYHNKSIICLYSFADRKQTTIGGQQYMKFKIFTRGRANGFTICDMMGGAPTGFPEHELASVSAFKESMGGNKTEYFGNFDLLLNPRLYKIFKGYYSRKK
jgi:lipid II:glycine glycyltransferase (peptidoglycan interpeptide bridge formation enzyme)